MNLIHKKRLITIISVICVISISLALVLYALKQNINLFYTPTQLIQAKLYPNQILRIGGYVKQHTIHFDPSGQNVQFIITDNVNNIHVNYHGVLPSLFREGQGVVVTGKLSDKHAFLANQVLAKHDEKYMPLGFKK